MNPQYNNCEGRDKFATRQCQICGRLVYDFGARSVNADLLTEVNEGRMQDSDGTLIEDDSYVLATPAARTKATWINTFSPITPQTPPLWAWVFQTRAWLIRLGQ